MYQCPSPFIIEAGVEPAAKAEGPGGIILGGGGLGSIRGSACALEYDTGRQPS
jgi:hypothetical protein